MDWMYESMPWYVAGPLIAAIMTLLILSGKTFGVSSNLRTICSISGGGKFADFFRFDWRSQTWNLVFAIGAIGGGFLASEFLVAEAAIDLNPATVESLEGVGLEPKAQSFVPEQFFGLEALKSWQGWVFLIFGGVLVGFGARYAGGCTSGHAISGLSNLQIPSLIAVIGFFIGGLMMTHLILPSIF